MLHQRSDGVKVAEPDESSSCATRDRDTVCEHAQFHDTVTYPENPHEEWSTPVDVDLVGFTLRLSELWGGIM